MTEGSEKSEVSRRTFLKTGIGTAAAGLVALNANAQIAQPKVLGANDRLRVAVIGLHGRGNDHIRALSKIQNVEIAALCDVDMSILNQRIAEIEKMGRPKPKGYQDVRKLLDDKTIDAVSVATPNSWHCLIGIWAAQAGKDIYVEKPLSHNLWEGHQLLRAVEKYGRMGQHGTQCRSSVAYRSAMDKLHNGMIGDIYMARGLCFKWRNTIGHTPPSAIPAGVDYDLWQGPAPVHVFTKNRFLYNWNWFWWYGNGDLGNQGTHQLDAARWGMGVRFPNKISAIGAHFMFDDDQQTPNTINCAFEYYIPNAKPKMIEFEVRHWITNHEAEIGTPARGVPAPKIQHTATASAPPSGAPSSIGAIFYGTKGMMSMGDEDAQTWGTWMGEAHEPGEGGESKETNDTVGNFQNWLDCVRSRRSEDLHAPISEAYVSAGMVHLANTSYRLGRTLHFNPQTELVIGDDEANLLLRDGKRRYRPPFVVPENV